LRLDISRRGDVAQSADGWWIHTPLGELPKLAEVFSDDLAGYLEITKKQGSVFAGGFLQSFGTLEVELTDLIRDSASEEPQIFAQGRSDAECSHGDRFGTLGI